MYVCVVSEVQKQVPRHRETAFNDCTLLSILRGDCRNVVCSSSGE
jgi:hypothetical protein